MRIDLHAHSSVSDGTDTPAELVRAAAYAGLDVVALTDHDTSAGWAQAAAALPRGLRLVPGAELSCSAPDGRGGVLTVHLLAYLYHPDSVVLAEEQVRLRAERRARLHGMARQMAGDGFRIDADALLAALPADSSAGRPHLARALMRAGAVSSVDEAFARFLGNDGPYYLPRADTPVRRAISMIADAGGVTVLAHPFATTRGPVITAEVLAELAAHGLSGVEVDHPDQDAATRTELRGLADELGLVRTGSSDYHGTNKVVRLGQETTAPGEFEALLDQASGTVVGG